MLSLTVLGFVSLRAQQDSPVPLPAGIRYVTSVEGNAVLVVAGKFDESKTLALVDGAFSPIPKPTRVLRRTYTAELT